MHIAQTFPNEIEPVMNSSFTDDTAAVLFVDPVRACHEHLEPVRTRTGSTGATRCIPGIIVTHMIGDATGQTLAVVRACTALHRSGHPEEVASLVSWLCSDEALFVSDAHFSVDGGYMVG